MERASSISDSRDSYISFDFRESQSLQSICDAERTDKNTMIKVM